jgi:hypothetical protein
LNIMFEVCDSFSCVFIGAKSKQLLLDQVQRLGIKPWLKPHVSFCGWSIYCRNVIFPKLIWSNLCVITSKLCTSPPIQFFMRGQRI